MRFVANSLSFLLTCLLAAGNEAPCIDGSEALSPERSHLLLKYGITLYGGQFIVGKDIIADCNQRKALSAFLTDVVLRNGASTADREFAEQHREIVGRTIKILWPRIGSTPAVPSDGTLRHEKWNLLLEDWLPEQDVSILVSDFVRQSGFGADSGYLLMHRPLAGLIPFATQTIQNDRASVSERLYAIAFLSRAEGVKAASPFLEKIAKSDQLTRPEQVAVRRLLDSLSSGKPAKWEDVESLVEEE